VQIAYLGGATITHTGWDLTVPEVGIPVARIFGQSLEIMLEFDDTGYHYTNMFGEPTNTTYGAGNHLFDLDRKGDGVRDFDVKYCEPVYKAVTLNRSWERSQVKEIPNKDQFTNPDNEREWEFSLSTHDLKYGDDKGKVWDPDFKDSGGSDSRLDKLEFTFHIGAKADQVTIDNIPWYDIDVSGDSVENLTIDKTSKAESHSFEGTSITGNFKYDHDIEGWDYHAGKSNNTYLMLETVAIYGTFIPNIVNDWINKQFVDDERLNNATATYNTPMGEQDLSVDQDIPVNASLLSKEAISFRDNWRQVGEVNWVSNVTVDGNDEDMYAQIHAKEDFTHMQTEKKDGYASGMLLLSGYIYPAGKKIYHDPAYTANALLLNIPIVLKFNSVSNNFLVCQGVIAVMAVIGVVSFAVIRKIRQKAKKE